MSFRGPRFTKNFRKKLKQVFDNNRVIGAQLGMRVLLVSMLSLWSDSFIMKIYLDSDKQGFRLCKITPEKLIDKLRKTLRFCANQARGTVSCNKYWQVAHQAVTKQADGPTGWAGHNMGSSSSSPYWPTCMSGLGERLAFLYKRCSAWILHLVQWVFKALPMSHLAVKKPVFTLSWLKLP